MAPSGLRAGQTSEEAKEGDRRSSQNQPKWWRAGQSTFSLPLLLLLPLCPCPYSCLSFPFRGKCLTFLGCNSEERSILVPCGIIPFGVFGRVFVFGIRSRVTCHRSAHFKFSRPAVKVRFQKKKPQNTKHQPDSKRKKTFRNFFFCSTLLRCDLFAKKVAGGTPYSQHTPPATSCARTTSFFSYCLCRL